MSLAAQATTARRTGICACCRRAVLKDEHQIVHDEDGWVHLECAEARAEREGDDQDHDEQPWWKQ